jgi:histidinol-phosphate aminotransferase
MSATSFIRQNVRKLQPYLPGEQPKVAGLIKLNTNENPYPPSPQVLAAVKAAIDGRLRLYPNPSAQELREKLARLHNCDPDNIIVGNGSDELLAMAVRAFVEPAIGRTRGASNGAMKHRSADSRSTVQFFTPSYSLYPVLADIHGSARISHPLNSDFSLPSIAVLKKRRIWDFRAALTFVTTPNAPSGCGYATSGLERLCMAQKGVVLLDEAYVDFSSENALRLGLELDNVLVARTFSKAYSLCFQRVGYFVGDKLLIEALQKIRDSYNVNGLGQVAALATLDNLHYYQANFRKIISIRHALAEHLEELGFQVFPSHTNFILVRPPVLSAEDWLSKLRAHKILVRWFNSPELKDYLRVTIGTKKQSEALVRISRRILKST